MQLPGEIGQLSNIRALASQLEQIDSTLNHRLSDATRARVLNIGEINDAVEKTVGKLSHVYSWKRRSRTVSSKFSDDIKRSTNPVSYFPARNSPLRMTAAWNGTVVLIPVM